MINEKRKDNILHMVSKDFIKLYLDIYGKEPSKEEIQLYVQTISDIFGSELDSQINGGEYVEEWNQETS